MRIVVLNNGIVENIVVAEENSLEEAISILNLAFPNRETVLETDYAGVPCVNGDIYDGTFRPEKPYDSWIWENSKWNAPVEMPTETFFVYEWDENSLNWVIAPPPYPSWSIGENSYLPPVPMPETGVWAWDEESVSWKEVPKPFPSWTYDEETRTWLSPVECPNDGNSYNWDEDSMSWVELY